jgi:hypothetical protein
VEDETSHVSEERMRYCPSFYSRCFEISDGLTSGRPLTS